MSIESNRALAEGFYNALAAADIPWLQEHAHPDIVFTQAGRNPLAGTFKGMDEILGHLGQFFEFSGGDFTIKPYELLVSEDYVVGLVKADIGRTDGQRLQFEEVHICRIEDGKLRELNAIPRDAYPFDEFLSGGTGNE